jgi:hypothetical protein
MQGDFYNALLQQQIQNHAETMRTLGSLESTLESVHEETRRTNGRVTRLENQVKSLQESRSYALGGLAVVGAFAAFIGAGFTFVYEWWFKTKV